MTEWRPVVAAVAGTLLLAGCTSGADGGSAGEEKKGSARSTSGSDGAGSSASADGTDTTTPADGADPSSSAAAVAEDEPYTMAEELAPRTRSEAVAFVRGLTPRADNFGSGFRKAQPYESDPGEWAVLDEDCVWQRQPLPDTALASLTRRFELPGSEGKGPVQVSMTVTVHKDTTAARRDMAVSLEEALRCPNQRLNATEQVRGLYSRADPFSEARNGVTDDDLIESGELLVDGIKGALPFDWFKYRLGPVTVAATDRIGAGHTDEEASRIASQVAQGVAYTAAEIDSIGGNTARDGAEGKDGSDDAEARDE
ncbi:hypothetical protein ACF063_04315 [Streptomyces chartreusis]|uniref:hypothetical protein n=1 Tax=Streptomyces chartreusis TaxID=1969 RepID=UPI0036F4E2B2